MKKLVALMMVISLIGAMSVTAFAGRTLTDDEKRLVSELNGKEVLGQKVTAADITAFENYLMGTDQPIAAGDVDVIIADIDEVINLVKASGVSSLTELKSDVKEKILSITNSAAALAGLSVSIANSGSAAKVTITDLSGTPVIIKEEVIKKTGGNDYSQVLFASAILVVSAASLVLLFNRARKIRQEASILGA